MTAAAVGPHAAWETSISNVNLDVIRRGMALTCFEHGFEAHQKCGPLGAAVMHEFNRIFPVGVLENNECLVAPGFQAKEDFRSYPFFRA